MASEPSRPSPSPRPEEGAPSARAQRLARRLSRLSGVLSGLIGALVLLGWVTGEVRLTSISARYPVMVPNTAVALVLASVASWLLALPARERALVWTGRLAALAVTGIGALVLLEYVIGPIGIDELLFSVPQSMMAPKGRPAVNTSVALVAAGVSLLLLGMPRRGIRPSDVAACVVGAAGLGGLASYLYGAAPLYGIPGHVPQPGMALPTAIAFVLLGLSLLSARPHVGIAGMLLSPNLGGVVARHLIAIGSLFPVLGAIVVAGQQRGFYGAAVAASILTTGGVVLGLVVVTVTGIELNELDAIRKRASFEQARLAAIVDSSADAILSASLEGMVLTWNRTAERMYGYSASEAIGNPEMTKRVVPEDHRDEIPALIAKVRGGERVEGFETVRRRKNGEIIDVSLTMSPVLDETGRAVAISSIARDISERKRAEAERLRSHATEQRLRQQLEAVGQAGLLTFEAVMGAPEQSLPHTLEVIVEQARKLTGAPFGALGTMNREGTRFDTWVFRGMTQEQVARIGRYPRPVGLLGSVAREGAPILLPDLRADGRFLGLPPDHPEMQAFLAQPIRHRDRVLGNLYLAKPPGEPAFTDEDARTVALLGTRAAIAIHIAELYEQEAQKRGWLQAVVNQVPEAIILLDADGKRAATNAAAAALASTDTSQRDPFGNPYAFDVRYPSGAPVALDDLPLVRALARHEITRSEELQIRRADGAVVPILASAAPALDEAGRTLGAALVMQDITVRKELDRLRDEWTSVIAHDLRQPVGVILLSAALLERSELSDRDRSHVDRVRNAAVRLRAMIDDLLDASRLEADRLTLETRYEDPAPLLDRMLDHLAPVLAGRRLVVTREGSFQPVLVDPGRVEQVLGNLLSNAVKYGEPGTDIEISLANLVDAAEVSVTNIGRGIPPDEMSELFGRFKRSSAGTGSGISGIGLGLYICKGLVEAHGGRIRAESTPGERTRFAFTLPYASSRAAAA